MQTTAIKQYEEQGKQLLKQARAILIVDDTTRGIAADFTANARRVVKVIEEEFRPDIDKAHQLHKNLLARLKKLTEPFKQAQSIVDNEIKRDYLEREHARQEEERKQREKEEHEKKLQEEALRKEAEDKIRSGDIESAEELLNSEIVIARKPIEYVDKTVRSDGGSITARKDIDVELVSKQDVIMAVYEGKLPDKFLDVNMMAAKQYIKFNDLKVLAGFRITETAIISGRTR